VEILRLTPYRIVRDYEKYIARQFKRGTSRQELNVSWLKKNELDLKRHVSEIRDSIKTNWTTTGQEVGKELQKFWQGSRPGSPARMGSYSEEHAKSASALNSPSALAHLSHRLQIPGSSPSGPSNDFATGYSLGLIGGVRSWVSDLTDLEQSRVFINSQQMTKGRQTNRDSRQGSDDSDNDSDGRSPSRGRHGKLDQQVDEQIASMVAEGTKKSGD
jgi:choline-phosphate cytidylyltransferase